MFDSRSVANLVANPPLPSLQSLSNPSSLKEVINTHPTLTSALYALSLRNTELSSSSTRYRQV